MRAYFILGAMDLVILVSVCGKYRPLGACENIVKQVGNYNTLEGLSLHIELRPQCTYMCFSFVYISVLHHIRN